MVIELVEGLAAGDGSKPTFEPSISGVINICYIVEMACWGSPSFK